MKKTTENSSKSIGKPTKLDEQFKKFRKHLATDEDLTFNLFAEIKNEYSNKKIDFYDFIDKMQFYNKIFYQYAEHLTSTAIAKIEISDNNVIFTTREENIKIIFNGKDRRGVPFEMINWGSYEKSENKIFDALLSDGMTILDVGANIGWYSLLWGKKLRNATIHAFEPIVETYNYLVSNVTLNGLVNVVTHNLALSDKEDQIKFHYYPGGACLASAKNVIGYEQAEEVICQGKTLDSLENLWLKNIDLIKCDVEGAELLMLKGSIKTIENHRPIIALELIYEWCRAFNYHPNEVFGFLKCLGYKAFLPKGYNLQEVDCYVANDFECQNYFFLHENKHEKIIKSLSIA